MARRFRRKSQLSKADLTDQAQFFPQAFPELQPRQLPTFPGVGPRISNLPQRGLRKDPLLELLKSQGVSRSKPKTFRGSDDQFLESYSKSRKKKTKAPTQKEAPKQSYLRRQINKYKKGPVSAFLSDLTGGPISKPIAGATKSFIMDTPLAKAITEKDKNKAETARREMEFKTAKGRKRKFYEVLPGTKKEAGEATFDTVLGLFGEGALKSVGKGITKKIGGKATKELVEQAGKYKRVGKFKKAVRSGEIGPKDISGKLDFEDINKLYKEGARESVTLDTGKYLENQIAKQKKAGKLESGGLLRKGKNFYQDAKTKLVDFAAPIEDVLNKAEQKGKYKILPEKHITNQIDRVLRNPTLAGSFVKKHGLEDVIKKAPNLEHLDQFLIAKQAKDVAKKGIQTGRNIAKDTKLLDDLAPIYKDQAKVVNDYSRKLLDYSVDSGLIGKEMADGLKKKYPNYVPLKRVFNDLEKIDRGSSKSIASIGKQNIVQKLEGSKREIESPVESLMEKTVAAFEQGEKNKAAKMLASYEKLPGNPFNLKELKAGESAAHTISYLDKGVKRTFETTPEIAVAAKALDVQQLNIVGQILALPVRVARIGITGINLPFIASNIVRDQATAIINSKHVLKTSIANPAVYIKSLLEAVGHGKLYQEMAEQGALGTSFDIARNQIKPTIGRLRSGKSIASKIKYTIKHPSELLRTVENIVGRSEEFTRIAQYAGTKQAALKKGMGKQGALIEASRAARENTVNFARRGEWGGVLNHAWLYLNASIQGTRTFVRNMKTRPLQTATKLAVVGFTPVAAFTAWNLSDPKRKAAYDDISDYEKENNYIIVPPNPTQNEDDSWNIIKIPLSQEISSLVNMVRRPIEQAYGLDPVSVQDVAKSLVGSVSPIEPDKESILSTIVPQAIKPTIEAKTNYNLFTGKPIVPDYLKELSPENQTYPWTSGTARKIGGALGVSPLKTEAFVKGTFGGVGAQALNVSDRMLAKAGAIPEDQIGGQDVSKAIVSRFAKARGGETEDRSTKEVEERAQKQRDEKYLLKQEANKVYDSLKDLPKEEANAKAKEVEASNPQLYSQLERIVANKKTPLSKEESAMFELNIDNWARANYIHDKATRLETREERNAYIKDLERKRIVSKTVMKQLIVLIKRNAGN